MYNTAFYIIISILILSYILSIYLNRLNTKSRNVNIPIELEGIYDTEKYKKSQNYGKANSKFIFLTSTITLILTLLMLSFHGFNFINEFALSLSENIIISALMFFGILMFVSDIIGIPFSIYSTFVIEEKFGFNKTTVKTFIFDKIKGWLLGATIGGSFFTLIIWLYSFNKEMFWIWAWIAVSFFSIFMAML